jgi:HTH-type transcriptional regulator, transcriptional repressor of NAD biosynthesis genes
MSTEFASGLVVGKFAPLHRGHELVIRRAMEACDTLCVLSWSKPEMPGCEPERRAAWLERLFPAARRLVLTDASLAALNPPPEFALLPANDSDAVVHRRLCAWLCERVWQLQPDAVFTGEQYGAPFAEEMTAWFRRSDPAHPGVTAVCVDPARTVVPVSGSLLRDDIHRHRQWLSPEVYRDFVKRAVLLGAESTGKSTLAAALAERLETVHVPEFGRELWEARDGRLEFSDMLRIAREQIAREEAAAGRANEWLICDTSPLTTLFYSRRLFGNSDPALVGLAARPYDLTMLCAPDYPLVQDGTRQDEAFRAAQDAWYRRELAARGIDFVTASGSISERVDHLAAVMGK